MTRLSKLRRLILSLVLLGLLIQPAYADQSSEWPAPKSADDATRLAARYVADRKLDVSRYHILPARFVDTGPWTDSSLGKGPYWQVTYELPNADGGQYFILVYLSGKIGYIGGL